MVALQFNEVVKAHAKSLIKQNDTYNIIIIWQVELVRFSYLGSDNGADVDYCTDIFAYWSPNMAHFYIASRESHNYFHTFHNYCNSRKVDYEYHICYLLTHMESGIMNAMIAKYKEYKKVSLFPHGYEENISWFHYIIVRWAFFLQWSRQGRDLIFLDLYNVHTYYS